jgi:plastocyanin
VDRPRVLVLAAAVVTVVASVAAIGAAATSSDDGGGNAVATTEPGGSTIPPTGSATVEIRDFAFNPPELTVQPGTVVTWTNGDSETHTIESEGGSFSSPDLDSGATFSFTFNEPGTFPYICSIHTSMHGTIVVEG